MIEYDLIRSDRRTISLQITPEGRVLVRAPRRCAKGFIDRFVLEKENWIHVHQKRVLAALEDREEFRLKDGGSLMFCGEPYRVILTRERRLSLDLQNKTLTLQDQPISQLTPGVRRMYQRGGLPWIEQRLKYWAEIMRITYGKVNISTAVRRWGSCSVNGDIHISWLLLFAPPKAIDYVLIHELCHRVEFNHSPAFWALVARYMPDYQEQKQVLRSLHSQLFSQGWSTK